MRFLLMVNSSLSEGCLGVADAVVVVGEVGLSPPGQDERKETILSTYSIAWEAITVKSRVFVPSIEFSITRLLKPNVFSFVRFLELPNFFETVFLCFGGLNSEFH